MYSAGRSLRVWGFVLVTSLPLASCILRQETALSRQETQLLAPPPATSAAPAPVAASRVTVQAAYGKLPLQFEANQGQSDEQVQFLARGHRYTVFLTATEAVLALRNAERARLADDFKPSRSALSRQQASVSTETVLRMHLVGANSQPQVTGAAELPGKSHYFFGSDATQWHTNIPTYAKVKYENVYPGVDLVYYGNQGQLEYDFVVAPGANPNVIRLAFAGPEGASGQGKESQTDAAPIHLDANGDLTLQTEGGELRFHQPRIYQDINGSKQPVAGRYVLLDSETADAGPRTQQVGFAVATYDLSKPLIIDPVLVYSTLLGGSNDDYGLSIAVDTEGNAYVTGVTYSTDFPTVAGVIQPRCNADPACAEAFVAKLNATGSALLYATYIGGKKRNPGFGFIEADRGTGIAVDAAGNAYVTGFTSSLEFPTTPGAFQAACQTNSIGDCDEAFVTKLNPTGSALVYSTYLGGSSYDYSYGIALDSAGNAYVTGETDSLDFPTTPGAFQAACQTNKAGSCDDAFVVKLNPIGSALVYSTYLGGSRSDEPSDIALDSAGNAYVTGFTTSLEFPTTPGAFQAACQTNSIGHCNDAFVVKLNSTGSALVYSTYLGGSRSDGAGNIALDSAGNAYVSGGTSSLDFPTTPGAFQAACQTDSTGSCSDAFVVKLNPTGSALVYSTYFGGDSSDGASAIAVDTTGNVYFAGYTGSSDLPTTTDAFQPACSGPSDSCNYDAFVTKLNAAGSELVYSTYLGGIANDSTSDIAIRPVANLSQRGHRMSS